MFRSTQMKNMTSYSKAFSGYTSPKFSNNDWTFDRSSIKPYSLKFYGYYYHKPAFGFFLYWHVSLYLKSFHYN